MAGLVASSCSAPQKEVGQYRDLNKNGRMDVYEDRSASVDDRVNDLLGQMTIEEKAGLMFINGTFVNDDGHLRSGKTLRVLLHGFPRLLSLSTTER